MVAVLVRLKLSLLRRSFTRSGWAAFGMVVAYLYALGVVVPLTVGLVVLRDAPVDVARGLSVSGFAALSLGWLLFPLLLSGVDETLDPARFALLPVPARRLLPGLVVASFLGAPGMALILLSIGFVATWSRGPAEVLAALASAALGAVTCVLLSRSLTTALAGLLSTRRTKEWVAAIVAFLAMFVGLGIQAATSWLPRLVPASTEPGEILARVASVVAWTPFGWAWSVPGDVAAGAYVLAGVRLALAVALATALLAWWSQGLALALVSPPSGVGGARRVRVGRGVERVFGVSPQGAIATRIVRSWRRDGRAASQMASLVFLPLVMVLPSTMYASDGRRWSMLLAVGPLLALFGSLNASQSLVFDGTASALHALTGVPGRLDRWGRAMAYLLLVGSMSLVAVGICLALSREWRLAPALLGLTLSVTGVGIGVASWASARHQWPVAPPGGNAFAKNSGGGAAGLIVSALLMAGTALGSLPAVILTVFAALGSSTAGWACLFVGPAIGAAVLWWGCERGGAALDRRWPEALAAMSR